MSDYTCGNDDSIIENFDIRQLDDEKERLKEKVDKSDQEKDKTPSPVTAMYYFFVLSIFYMIISIILIYTSVASGSSEIAINLIFILLLVLGLYFINMSTIKNLCGSDDDNYIIPYKKVGTITFIPWVIVFGTIFFLLELFPGWVRPFSNTIGYLIINFLGVESELKKYLKDANETESSDATRGNKSLGTAIEFLNKNTSMFINEFPSDGAGFDKSFEQLQKSDALKSTTSLQASHVSLKDLKIFLKKMIKIKHTIGKGVWYILAGTVVSSVSYNILLDIECQKSREKVTRSINNLYAEKLSKTGRKWRLMRPEFEDSNGKMQRIRTDAHTDTQGNNNNLSSKETPNGVGYTYLDYKTISENVNFVKRFNTRDDTGNLSMPYNDNKINWEGTVTFEPQQMRLYNMDNSDLEEGYYIAIPVDTANIISYTYVSPDSTSGAPPGEKELTHLFYEVIE